MSEHAQLRDVARLCDAYLQQIENLEQSRQLLEDPELDPELREMAETELGEIEEQLPEAERELMLALLPARPEDSRNTIIEIRAGTGGDEAALFAADLYRMYNRYAESQQWKTSIIDANASSIGGFKEVVFSVEGHNVYRMLRYESGVHRVQRIPVTESGGRIHTSAATVAVLPEADDIDDIPINNDDLRIDIFRSSGPGGQSVNTTDSAVRITHLPSGIVVQSQDERSQHRNKEKAMRVLKARLLDHVRSEEAAKTASNRRSQIGSGDRSERIRTYNFPQNRLTDHRINLTLYSLDRIMEGLLDDLFNALAEADAETRLQEQTSLSALGSEH
jgi:peptide chain release factor 1